MTSFTGQKVQVGRQAGRQNLHMQCGVSDLIVDKQQGTVTLQSRASQILFHVSTLATTCRSTHTLPIPAHTGYPPTAATAVFSNNAYCCRLQDATRSGVRATDLRTTVLFVRSGTVGHIGARCFIVVRYSHHI